MTWQAGEQVSLCDLGIWSGKMSPEPSAPTEGKTSQPSSKKPSASQSRKPPILKCLKKVGTPGGDTTMKWEDDGAWRGECLTRNTGESPNVAVESRLSQILEATPHGKYCLTGKACQGILTRAERRGKDFPPVLKAVLVTQSQSTIKQPDAPVGGPTRNYDGAGNGLGIGKDGDPSPTLTAGDRHGVCAGFKLGNSEHARSIGYAEEQAPTLNAECGGNKPAVMCLNDQGGSMMGVSHDVSGTLRAQEHGHQPSILDMSHACDVIQDCGEVAHSLQARMGTGGNQIPLTYQKTTGTLSPGAHAGSYNGQDAYNDMLVCGAAVPDVAHTLKAKANCDYRWDSETYPVQNMVVRRLTPLECERLQGFPDHWTDLGEWTDSKGKRHKDADSPRYKALGNSIALPPWKWLLKRLCGNYERDATMASLFDGIGGFPLIWEQLNGRGTCLWASEIEEFPIAVTKRRFGTLEEPGDMGRFLFPCGKDEL